MRICCECANDAGTFHVENQRTNSLNEIKKDSYMQCGHKCGVIFRAFKATVLRNRESLYWQLSKRQPAQMLLT